MRVGGPADLFADGAQPLRAARARPLRPVTRASRTSSSAAARDLVISDAGIRGLVIQNRAERSRFDGERVRRRRGLPMAQAATETQRRRPVRAGVRPGHPGHRRRRGVGQRRRARVRRARPCSIGRASSTPTAARRRWPPRTWRWPTATARFKHAPEGSPPEIVLGRPSDLEPADADAIKARLDEIRRWRQAHQPLGMPSAGQRLPQPRRDLGRAAHRRAGPQGPPDRRRDGVSEKHANFIVNDQKGSAADVRRLGEHVRAGRPRALGRRARSEIVFAGDWSGLGGRGREA